VEPQLRVTVVVAIVAAVIIAAATIAHVSAWR
jgi:hypothetical protein